MSVISALAAIVILCAILTLLATLWMNWECSSTRFQLAILRPIFGRKTRGKRLEAESGSMLIEYQYSRCHERYLIWFNQSHGWRIGRTDRHSVQTWCKITPDEVECLFLFQAARTCPLIYLGSLYQKAKALN